MKLLLESKEGDVFTNKFSLSTFSILPSLEQFLSDQLI